MTYAVQRKEGRLKMTKLKSRKNIDMTEGPILKNIILFALPLIVTNLLQVLYTASDTMVVSLSGEPDAVGAIGTTTAMINLIVNIFIGCSVGAKVAAARSMGARDDKQTENIVHTAITLSIIFGLVCAVIGVFAARPVLSAMGNEGKLLELAVRYTKIYFLGVPFISVTNFAMAIIHAGGDTKTPLYILTFTGFLNVALNLFFVLVCKFAVGGMAAATGISNVVSAVFFVALLMRRGDACRLSLKKLRIEKESLLSILHIGLPAGFQSALFSLSHMVIQSSIVSVNNAVAPAGSAFAPVVKGSSAATSVESFGYTVINAVAQAAISFTGQNAGAGKYDRVKKIYRACYSASFCLAVIFAVVMLALRDPMLSLYGVARGEAGSPEEIAYETAVTRMLCMFIPYFLLGFMEVGSGVMQGLGRSVTSTAVSLTGSVAFRILWIMTAFRAYPNIVIVFLSYPISWLLTAAAHYVCVRIVLGRLNSAKRAEI